MKPGDILKPLYTFEPTLGKDEQPLRFYKINQTQMPLLPTVAAERKKIPLFTGVLAYFPLAFVELARVSQVGNDQHNPGQPLHWDRTKSMDQMDTATRHMVDWINTKRDTDGTCHLAKAIWRLAAQLQLDLEEERHANTQENNKEV